VKTVFGIFVIELGAFVAAVFDSHKCYKPHTSGGISEYRYIIKF